jgi:hypothetical protein
VVGWGEGCEGSGRIINQSREETLFEVWRVVRGGESSLG